MACLKLCEIMYIIICVIFGVRDTGGPHTRNRPNYSRGQVVGGLVDGDPTKHCST